jgi:hypothetical protein
MPEIPEKSVIVFNKIDRLDREALAEAQQRYPEAMFISATKHLGLETNGTKISPNPCLVSFSAWRLGTDFERLCLSSSPWRQSLRDGNQSG